MTSVETLRKLIGMDDDAFCDDALSRPFEFQLSETKDSTAVCEERKVQKETEEAAAALASAKSSIENFGAGWDDALLCEFMVSARNVKVSSGAETTAHLVSEGKLPALSIDMHVGEAPPTVADPSCATKIRHV